MDEYMIEVSSNIGNVKNENQDNFCADGAYRKYSNQNNNFSCKVRDYLIVGVFDGMSGEKDGDMASMITANLFANIRNKCVGKRIDEIIREVYQEANNQIREKITDRIPCGTTATVVVIDKNSKYKVFHVGDSIVYLLKNDEMIKLTRDETKAQLLVDIGVYNNLNEASAYQKSILTNYVGIDCTNNELIVNESEWMNLDGNEKLLLCTDGLSKMCDEEEIYDIMKKNVSGITEKLNLTAISKGGMDNVTTIVLSRQ